jgi:para-nitrobenzyl esterase
VTIADGKVESDIVGGSERFLKIPYAKPPLGPLRWKAPEKNDPWTGVRHESEFAKPCAQNASNQGPASTNEDCLYLNVWTPRPAATKAPVMVWIHGGGNFAGSAADYLPGPPAGEAPLWYDGQFFAARHGVVLVSMNYRLGPLGFFSHPGLGAEGSPMGNQGLLDQHAVLEWVRDNIAAFGGDPANVTIFGESAGSADVCHHVVSPKSRGLFHRAISQSGGCTSSMGGGREPLATDPSLGIEHFTSDVGCSSASDQLACLRGKPIADIMAHAAQPNPSSGTFGDGRVRFGIVVDGPNGFVTDQPRTLFDQGNIAKVPYLLGSNNDEGMLFLLTATIPTNDAEYEADLTKRYGASAPDVIATYPVSKFGGNYRNALGRVLGDAGLVCGTHDTARRAVKAGLPVYMYNFNVPWSIAPGLLLVAHAAEMSHVFGNPWLPTPDPGSKAVGDAMNEFWATFAKTGDPNFSGAPAVWPVFAPDANDDDERLQLDPNWEVLKSFRKAECAMWRKTYDAAFAAGDAAP